MAEGISTTRALLRVWLLGTTALLPVTAAAQAPNARPTGGQVVAGSATIGQTAAQTTINQSSNRAAIDWRQFNVGRDHAVQFNQPSAQSWTLNRVTGPDPSVIAGRVTANGGVAIVNQSGVVFAQGAQVNVGSLIASAANITNENFMAGRMVFDGPPHPGARVENHGSVTVADRGLAALVGPRVSNTGVIRARLGKVALAGAETYSLDLAGDGLLSIDVTQAVRTAPDGGAALVTNSGIIEAQGGSVLISAQAASGLVEDLVRNTGRISANSDSGRQGQVALQAQGGGLRVEGVVEATGGAGQRGGRIAAEATEGVTVAAGARVNASGAAGGGSVQLGSRSTRQARVEGAVTARGTGRGAKGGTVAVQAAETVTVAAGARVDASGSAGGGTALVGTTGVGRDQQMALRTTVERGATLRADATEAGDGGIVAVNSTERTEMRGALSARGGAQGGQGGFIEISGQAGLVIDGQADVRAPAGAHGTLLIDPENIEVVDSLGSPTGPDENQEPPLPTQITADTADGGTLFVLNSDVESFAGTLRLDARNDVTISAGIDKTARDPETGREPGGLTIVAGRTVAVNASIAVSDDVTITANTLTSSAAGTITAGDVVSLRADTIDLGADVIAGGTVEVGPRAASAPFSLVLATPTTLRAPSVVVGRTSLGDRSDWTPSTGEALGTVIAATTITPPAITLPDGATLTVVGDAIDVQNPLTVRQGSIDLLATSGTITQDASGVLIANALRARAEGESGSVSLSAAENEVDMLAGRSAGAFAFANARALTVGTVLDTPGIAAANPGASVFLTSGTAPLTIDAPVSGTNVVLRADDLDIADRVAAPNGEINIRVHSIGRRVFLGAESESGLSLNGTELALLGGGGTAGDSPPASRLRITTGDGVELNGDVALRGRIATLELEGLGSVTQTAGSLDVGRLVGRVEGDFSIARPGAANLVDELAVRITGEAPGSVTVTAEGTQPQGLRIVADNGPNGLTDGIGGEAVPESITLTANALQLDAPVSGATVDLWATEGDITQAAAGVISATALHARSDAGAVLLGTAANLVTTVAGRSAGRFTLSGSGPLLVGTVLDTVGVLAADSGADVTLSASGMLTVEQAVTAGPGGTATLTGTAVQLDALVTAAAGTVDLQATAGDIAQASGSVAGIQASFLRAQASGSVDLRGTANLVQEVAGRTGSDFAFLNGQALVIGSALGTEGVIASTGGVDVRTALGGLSVHQAEEGGISVGAGTSLLLSAAGALDLEDGARIEAGSASPSVAGGILLQARAGDVTLRSAQVTAQAAGGTITLAATGSVTQQQGGTLVADGLRVLAGGGAVLDSSANRVGTLAALVATATDADFLFRNDGAVVVGSVTTPAPLGALLGTATTEGVEAERGAVTIRAVGTGNDLTLDRSVIARDAVTLEGRDIALTAAGAWVLSRTGQIGITASGSLSNAGVIYAAATGTGTNTGSFAAAGDGILNSGLIVLGDPRMEGNAGTVSSAAGTIDNQASGRILAGTVGSATADLTNTGQIGAAAVQAATLTNGAGGLILAGTVTSAEGSVLNAGTIQAHTVTGQVDVQNTAADAVILATTVQATTGDLRNAAGARIEEGTVDSTASLLLGVATLIDATTALTQARAGTPYAMTLSTTGGPVATGGSDLAATAGRDVVNLGLIRSTGLLTLTTLEGDVVNESTGTLQAAGNVVAVAGSAGTAAATGHILADGLIQSDDGYVLLDARVGSIVQRGGTIRARSDGGLVMLQAGPSGTAPVTAEAGYIWQTGGSIDATRLTLRAARAADLGTADNRIDILGEARTGLFATTPEEAAFALRTVATAGNPSGLLVVDGTISVGLDASGTLRQPGGRLVLLADDLDIFVESQLLAPAGTVLLAPVTAGMPILLGSAAVGPGAFRLSNAEIARISTWNRQGSGTDSSAAAFGTLAIGTATAGDILLGTLDLRPADSFGAGSDFASILARGLRLDTGGSVTQEAGTRVNVERLGVQAANGAVMLDEANIINEIASLDTVAFTPAAPVDIRTRTPGWTVTPRTAGLAAADGGIAAGLDASLTVAGIATGGAVLPPAVDSATGIPTGGGTALAVTGEIRTGSGRTLSITADDLELFARLAAPAGTVQLRPVTTGRSIVLGAAVPGSFSLTTAELRQIGGGGTDGATSPAALLRIGRFGDAASQRGGDILLVDDVLLRDAGAARVDALELFAGGGGVAGGVIEQTGGMLSVEALAGESAGATRLGGAENEIDRLTARRDMPEVSFRSGTASIVPADGAFVLTTTSDLAIEGDVQTRGASAPLTITTGGAMTIGAPDNAVSLRAGTAASNPADYGRDSRFGTDALRLVAAGDITNFGTVIGTGAVSGVSLLQSTGGSLINGNRILLGWGAPDPSGGGGVLVNGSIINTAQDGVAGSGEINAFRVEATAGQITVGAGAVLTVAEDVIAGTDMAVAGRLAAGRDVRAGGQINGGGLLIAGRDVAGLASIGQMIVGGCVCGTTGLTLGTAGFDNFAGRIDIAGSLDLAASLVVVDGVTAGGAVTVRTGARLVSTDISAGTEVTNEAGATIIARSLTAQAGGVTNAGRIEGGLIQPTGSAATVTTARGLSGNEVLVTTGSFGFAVTAQDLTVAAGLDIVNTASGLITTSTGATDPATYAAFPYAAPPPGSPLLDGAFAVLQSGPPAGTPATLALRAGTLGTGGGIRSDGSVTTNVVRRDVLTLSASGDLRLEGSNSFGLLGDVTVRQGLIRGTSYTLIGSATSELSLSLLSTGDLGVDEGSVATGGDALLQSAGGRVNIVNGAQLGSGGLLTIDGATGIAIENASLSAAGDARLQSAAGAVTLAGTSLDSAGGGVTIDGLAGVQLQGSSLSAASDAVLESASGTVGIADSTQLHAGGALTATGAAGIQLLGASLTAAGDVSLQSSTGAVDIAATTLTSTGGRLTATGAAGIQIAGSDLSALGDTALHASDGALRIIGSRLASPGGGLTALGAAGVQVTASSLSVAGDTTLQAPGGTMSIVRGQLDSTGGTLTLGSFGDLALQDTSLSAAHDVRLQSSAGMVALAGGTLGSRGGAVTVEGLAGIRLQGSTLSAAGAAALQSEHGAIIVSDDAWVSAGGSMALLGATGVELADSSLSAIGDTALQSASGAVGITDSRLDSTGGSLTIAGATGIRLTDARLSAADDAVLQSAAGPVAVSGSGLASAGGGLTLSSHAGVSVQDSSLFAAGPLTILDALEARLVRTTLSAEQARIAAPTILLDGVDAHIGAAILFQAPGGIDSAGPVTVTPRAADRLPAVIFDTRIAPPQDPLAVVQPDLPGRRDLDQPTQVRAGVGAEAPGAFGPSRSNPAGSVLLRLEAGQSPVFLLLDGGSATGTIHAGRLGVHGTGGKVELLGRLGHSTGPEAARFGDATRPIEPRSLQNYRINGCVLSSINCIVPPRFQPLPPLILTNVDISLRSATVSLVDVTISNSGENDYELQDVTISNSGENDYE